MEKEARFIIKDDKYSLIIIQLADSNKKAKKGISIFKKSLEINELNEDNINMVLNKKDKLIYSYANIGFIEISGIKCFMYCSEKDVKEVGVITYIKIYQILNISYLILEDMDVDTTSKLINFFKEHSKGEVNKGLFFGQDVYNMDKSFDVFFHRLYEMNKNICHINPNINFCYNNDNISYINKFEIKGFTTNVICGYFIQEIVNTSKKEEFITNLIIKEKEIHNENFIKNNELKEIEIILCPNNNIFLNQIFHFIFYAFIGYLTDAKLVINDLLKKDQSQKRTDNGAIIVIDIDNDLDKNPNEKIDIINKNIEKEMNQILGDKNKYIIIHKNKEIQKTIKSNKKYFSEIKYNYEFKGDEFILEFQEKQLLIISDSYENMILIVENILDFIKYQFLDKETELKTKIKSSIKTMLKSFQNFTTTKNSNMSNAMKLRVEAINEDYLKNKIINKQKMKLKRNLELNEKKAEKDINNINNNNEINIQNNDIINNNCDSENIDLKNKINGNKRNFYLYIVTYNTANYNFENSKEELKILNELLFPKEMEKLYEKKGYPTFYVIGLQEIVKLNTSNVIFDINKSSSNLWESKITEILLKSYNYTLQYRENMVGILLLIFVKASEAKNIKNMKKSVIKAGFMSALGNKGYIIYEFKYKEKTFSFGTGHLTAGENDKNFKNRTNLLINILNHKTDKNMNKFCENDFYFLFGDTNFRVKIDKKDFFEHFEKIKDTDIKFRLIDDSVITNNKPLYELNQKFDLILDKIMRRKRYSRSVKKLDIYQLNSFKNFQNKHDNENDVENLNLIAKRKIDESRYKYFFCKEHLNNDELNGFKNNLTSYNITENDINFLPTYKYIKGYNYYDLTKRMPAWTDRILYKKTENINCVKYDKINIKISDHRPVYGLFEINV